METKWHFPRKVVILFETLKVELPSFFLRDWFVPRAEDVPLTIRSLHLVRLLEYWATGGEGDASVSAKSGRSM